MAEGGGGVVKHHESQFSRLRTGSTERPRNSLLKTTPPSKTVRGRTTARSPCIHENSHSAAFVDVGPMRRGVVRRRGGAVHGESFNWKHFRVFSRTNQRISHTKYLLLPGPPPTFLPLPPPSFVPAIVPLSRAIVRVRSRTRVTRQHARAWYRRWARIIKRLSLDRKTKKKKTKIVKN